MAMDSTLRQSLRWWQISSIVICGTVGTGLFYNEGVALQAAGPAATLVAMLVAGIIVIAVWESLSEMTRLFPAPNALVEYISEFVDKDLAWIMGIAYWYTYASLLTLQIITAASISSYWSTSLILRLAFYIFATLVIGLINLFNVNLYGNIEAVAALFKIMLMLGSSIFMYYRAAQGGAGDVGNIESMNPIADGFTYNPSLANNSATAFFIALPQLAFKFVGIEIIAVTAFEARSLKDLTKRSRFVAYIIFIIYFLSVLGELLNIHWNNPHLPSLLNPSNSTSSSSIEDPPSRYIPVIVAWTSGNQLLSGFLTGCLVFNTLTAATTSLYVASRTLYGLTRATPRSFIQAIRHRLALVSRSSSVPVAAVLFSAFFFAWLPFSLLSGDVSTISVVTILGSAANSSCLLMWAAQCLAYIRYYHWSQKFKYQFDGRYNRYHRLSSIYEPYSIFSALQPWVAYIGLIGCLFIVLLSVSAPFWKSGDTNFTEVASAYLMPLLVLLTFIVSKLATRRSFVWMDDNFDQFSIRLDRLAWIKRDEIPEPVGALSMIEIHNGHHVDSRESRWKSYRLQGESQQTPTTT